MGQTQINKQGQQYIVDLAHTVHDLWVKMMQDLSLPEDSKFVEADFLATSKYHQFYDNALKQLWEAQAQYRAGGYVGLTIGRKVKT